MGEGGGEGCGGRGNGDGGEGAVVNVNLDEIKMEMGKLGQDTKNIKDALKEQTNDIKDIKIILEFSITEISTNLNGMRKQMDAIQNHASKSFEMLKELNYLYGKENIKSAHDVFFSRSKQGLERRIYQFENHVFELQAIHTAHEPKKDWKIS